MILTGKAENVPYSLSRWTDLPAAKWEWFRQQLKQQWMAAIDQRTSVPAKWSLRPEDTLGLIFWTKDPTNLTKDAHLLKAFPSVKVHMTITGWSEVEKGAPDIDEALALLQGTVEAFGTENVTWRFTPIPTVPDVLERFERIAKVAAKLGLSRVFVAFLQDNDLMHELRTVAQRKEILSNLGSIGNFYGIQVLLCNDDKELMDSQSTVALGVCAPPEGDSPVDRCGCVFVVDPFSINESCVFGCQFCYAADRSSSPKKRNTTRLHILR